MAQVTVRINGYAYVLGCQDGEEAHVEAMAAELDRRIDAIRASAGPGTEARMLVMAGLTLADELHELRQGGAAEPQREARIAKRLSRAAKRAEDVAERLEGT